jgi:type IV secretion system protein VirD4
MYKLSRLMLMSTVVAALYGLAIVTIIGWPVSGWVWGGILVIRFFRRRGAALTTLGSARFADEGDLQKSGMLDAESGLILGRLPVERRFRLNPGIGKLFRWSVAAKAACWELLSWPFRRQGPLVRLPRAIHTAVFIPSGGGKGVSCITPFLMTCPESCIVVDFKGENFALTGRHRQKAFGHRVVVLDPFNVVARGKSDTFNPLDFIRKENPQAIDECNDLANALIVRTGEEREPHWNDMAEFWTGATTATVVQYGNREGTRSLQMVREMLSHPQKLDMAVKLMCESGCWDGMLARMGGQLLHCVDKERSSTLSTVSRHLRFLDTPAVAASTRASSFDPNALRSGKMTCYLVLPPEHMRAQMGLLRLWIGSLLRAVVRGGLQERNKVHFILDEAASLGRLECINDAVDKFRGFGIRLQFYYQSMGQLRTSFPEDQGQTLLGNCTQVFAGVNDNQTAEFVSARIGETTIVVESGGTSWGGSYQATQGQHPSSSSGDSTNSSQNWQQSARKVLKPEEVMALPPQAAITFTPGVPPICTTLLRYYEERWLRRRRGWFVRSIAACWVLALSAAMCAATVGSAVVLSQLMEAQQRSAPAVPGFDLREFGEGRPNSWPC